MRACHPGNFRNKFRSFFFFFHRMELIISNYFTVMHGVVAQDVDKYIDQNPQLMPFFESLKSANKQLFLVTNSPYPFV